MKTYVLDKENVKSVLGKKGITYAEFSNLLGYENNWFSQVLSRDRELRLCKIEAFARTLDMPVEEFIAKCCKGDKPAKAESNETVEYGIANDVYTADMCIAMREQNELLKKQNSLLTLQISNQDRVIEQLKALVEAFK